MTISPNLFNMINHINPLTVDLGKPGPEDWFKGYDLGKGFDSFQSAAITKKKDAEGQFHPYLIASKDPDFKAHLIA